MENFQNIRIAVDVSWDEEKQGELKEVFRDGKLLIDQSLTEIRAQVKSEINIEA